MSIIPPAFSASFGRPFGICFKTIHPTTVPTHIGTVLSFFSACTPFYCTFPACSTFVYSF